MHKEINVWRKMEKGDLVRYRCLQSIQTGQFSVQSADFYPSGDLKLMQQHEQQFIELLMREENINPTFATLEDAIRNHDCEFGNQ